MKKRIVFSSYDDINNPFYAGGGASSVHEIARRLTSQFTVTVITGMYEGAVNKRVDKVSYKRIGWSILGPRVGQLVFYVLLPFYVRKEHFDLWIESFTPPFSTSCLQLFTKKPVIGLVHMLSAEDMERKYKLPFKFFERFGLKTYKYFIALTDVFKKRIASINKEAMIDLIPNGVDQTTYPKRPNNLQQYILYIGRIELDQKGLDLLISAYKDFARTSDTKLVIAGSGLSRDKRKLDELIHEADLQDKVVMVGRVSGSRKASLLQNCSAVIIPSRFETFCTVALEAMTYGKPVVHFSIDGLRWIPQACSVRVKSFSAKGLSRAMKKVLIDKKLNRQLAVQGKKAVKQYSWDLIFEKYTTTIQRVLTDYERQISSIHN